MNATNMSAASKIGIKSARIASGIVDVFVVLLILSLLLFSAYSIWDTNQVHGVACSSNYEIYRPTPENESLTFMELQALNPDVFAWLTVFGTNIDYPVVQGEDNIQYLTMDARGNFTASGAIFLDYRNSQDFTDFNNLVYGHHMAGQVMFGEVGMFREEEYFLARRYGRLYYNGIERGIEFFSFIHVDSSDRLLRADFTQTADKETYMHRIQHESINRRTDVDVTTADRLVVLVTCSAASTNGRDLLIGRLIDEIPEDPFETEETSIQITNIPVIDGLIGFWDGAGLTQRIILIALPCVLILLLVFLIYKKRNKRAYPAAYPTNIKGEKTE